MNDQWMMSRRVVEWMEKNLDPSLRILELGGGRGSKRIQIRWRNSLTIEHDPKWVGHLLRAGCSVMHRPLVDGWYEMDDELREEIQKADVLIIDGPPGYLRTNILPFMDLPKEGCILIIDDTHRAKNRSLIQDPIIATIKDEKRMTHITKRDAKNTDEGDSLSMDHKKPRSRRRRKVVSKPSMEKVSEMVPLDESSVRTMREGGEGL